MTKPATVYEKKSDTELQYYPVGDEVTTRQALENQKALLLQQKAETEAAYDARIDEVDTLIAAYDDLEIT